MNRYELRFEVGRWELWIYDGQDDEPRLEVYAGLDYALAAIRRLEKVAA